MTRVIVTELADADTAESDPELLKEARRGDGKGQSRLIHDISAAAVR
ncbi:hypothetical protein [Methylocystis rosea]|nr:hypothetical protein [Methylocystis rosea]